MTWLAIACSGPGAMAVIERNEAWGWKWFIGAALAALFAVVFAIVKRRASKWLWVTLVFCVLHPAVWMGARSGDCGHMLRFMAIPATVLVACFALISILRIRAAATPGTPEPAA
jgi:hypothetical protein